MDVRDKGSEAILKGNTIRDGKQEGVSVFTKSRATLENNIITGNDLSGVEMECHAAGTLIGNTIEGNGRCKVEWTEQQLQEWSKGSRLAYHSSAGLPGVRVVEWSTATMPPGSNTIGGNGKGVTPKALDQLDQIVVDATSKVSTKRPRKTELEMLRNEEP